MSCRTDSLIVGEAKKFEADLGGDIVQQVQECYEDKVAKAEGSFQRVLCTVGRNTNTTCTTTTQAS